MQSQTVSDRAQLYLLLDPDVLAIFEQGKQLETLYWSSPDLVYLRLDDVKHNSLGERVITDHKDRFVRFERSYNKPRTRVLRAAFTPDIKLAKLWASSLPGSRAWKRLRNAAPRNRRSAVTTRGATYDPADHTELALLANDLTKIWGGPGETILRSRQWSPGVWIDSTSSVGDQVRCVGPVWIGAGRKLSDEPAIIGPTILWDDPQHRPEPDEPVWPAVWQPDLPSFRKPTDPITQRARSVHNFFKRAFDIVFSLIGIALTLPIYPFLMLAVLIENGWPIFFAHRRETTGNRDFPCYKFRSMYKDAEERKAKLGRQNEVDGPQFFMEKDPRITRVGRFLRKSRLDELPQFFNVLFGHMSVVGPRPSPYKENQYCPAWREARLSVRPGITGLWQIKRTRKVGEDFQEWIKYDIEYVENASFSLDMIIILKTIWIVCVGLLPFKRNGKDASAS